MKPRDRARPEPEPLRLSNTTQEERAIADLVGRLPDASPDELQVARVWHRLHARERGPSVAWRWAAASVLALTLLVGAGRMWVLLSHVHANVLATEGGVFSRGTGAAWVPVRRGDPIPTGTLLRSDDAGQTLLSVSGVAALVLGTDADLTLERLGRSTLLQLERGRVTARVTKRPPGSGFVVRAGGFSVTVVGTLFSVTETVNGHVAVSVREGVVEVAGRGQSWRVEAGQRWSSETPDQFSPNDLTEARSELLLHAAEVPASPEIPGRFHELLRGEAAQSMTATPAPPPTSNSTVTPTATPTTAPTQSPGPKTHSLQSHEPAPSPPPSEMMARLDSPPPSYTVPPIVLAPDPTVLPVATPAPAQTATATPTTVTTRDFYAEALNLARHGEHHEAAKVLERALATGNGPRDLELYQLASLRQRHLSDAQGALYALLAYRQEYPSGALRQEVSLSIVEADLALGREDAALAETAHFLARYPANERADEIRLLRGDLLRKHGDCAKALAEYRSVVGGEALDDALYYAAYCRRELGDGAGASRALHEYLSRFPAGKHAAPARQALGQ